ncbi:signal recognition particle 54 kDa protein 1 [Selaginella moellendorffii]|uniref:signal recognition particle 54 kDa protein 1 n=1 Tax=Selaginella moellendorffii TaxID=88036 RepID=UPI000D1C9B54|nr:signal recognition particle 54 kDa protein 1 [Selaginella moellendorffii]|eukprot:XP_024538679.1 signal recognition particle 54 kDa protein 1 [Selaginella moellendorffii]
MIVGVGRACADTVRAGAFDPLKQNATKVKIPSEIDPVVIAQEGVRKFADAKHDLIILDTSGRHKQENEELAAARVFFLRILSICSRTLQNPDLIIFVMDSSIWQAANDQTLAFIESAKVGAVIITKMDGHAKGGGALNMGDIAGFAEKIKEVVPSELQPELLMSMIPGFNNVNVHSFDTQQLRKLYEKRS